MQNPKSNIYRLTGLKVMNNPNHTLHESILAWAGDLIEYSLPVIITFDPTWIIPDESDLLTKTINFNRTMLKMDLMQALVPQYFGAHTRKHISFPKAAYAVP